MPVPGREQGRDVLFFDGECGLCVRSARWLRRLDWLRRLKFQDALAADGVAMPVEFEEFMKGMPMRTRDGAVLVGFRALRRALVQTPVGFLPAALMYVPGLSHIGRRVYERIAANRARNVSCETKACDTQASSSSS